MCVCVCEREREREREKKKRVEKIYTDRFEKEGCEEEKWFPFGKRLVQSKRVKVANVKRV